MRPRGLVVIIVTSWLFAHGAARGESVNSGKDDIQIKCPWRGRLPLPDLVYVCSVDITDVADHDRWLVYWFSMNEPLHSTEPVSFVMMDRKYDELVFLNGNGFYVIAIPAHQPLHIKELRFVIEEQTRYVEEPRPATRRPDDITLWVGDALPLSNGESLGAIFKRLATAYAASGWRDRGGWKPPEGTTVALDPSGFKTIHLGPLPKELKPESRVDALYGACSYGWKMIRRRYMAKTGVTLHLVERRGHSRSRTIRRVLKPEQLTGEGSDQPICGIFDPKSDHFVQLCSPPDRKARVTCRIENGADRYTLKFEVEGGESHLVSIRGRVDD